MKKQIYIAFAILMVLGLIGGVFAFWPFTGFVAKTPTTVASNIVANVNDCVEKISGDNNGVFTVAGVTFSLDSDQKYYPDVCAGASKTFYQENPANPNGWDNFRGRTQIVERFCNSKKQIQVKFKTLKGNEICRNQLVSAGDYNGSDAFSAKVVTVQHACINTELGTYMNEYGIVKENQCLSAKKYKKFSCNADRTIKEETITCNNNCDRRLGCDICTTDDSKNDLTVPGTVRVRKADGNFTYCKDELTANGQIKQCKCTSDGKSVKLVAQKCPANSEGTVNADGVAYCAKFTMTINTVRAELLGLIGGLRTDVDPLKDADFGGQIDAVEVTNVGIQGNVSALEQRIIDLESAVNQLQNPAGNGDEAAA